MFYHKIKRNEFIERVITDILYADMKSGDVGFHKLAYDKLGLHNGKRIMKMRKKYNKISPDIGNAVYEDIIGIIVEEICQRGNKELYDDLMTYYKERFPYLKEKLENSEDNAHKWMEIYDTSFNQNDSGIAAFLKKSFVLLYCITYGQKEAVKTLLDICKEEEWMNEHYKHGRLLFYDRQKIRINSVQLIPEESDGVDNSEDDFMFDYLIEEQRELMADHFQIEPEEIEEFVLDHILYNMHGIYGDGNILFDMKFEGIQEELNDICKKYHITQLEFWDASKRQHYIEMIKKIYRKWCKRESRNLISDDHEGGDSLVICGYSSPFHHGDAERCLSELMTLFWFENYAINLQKFLDEYYKNFSFDIHEKDHEELRKANTSLTEELSQCKKKLQQYADADSERKRKENKEAKKADRQYIEKIASLEKKLEEYEIEMAHQKEVLSDIDTYISLIETGNNLNDATEEADISKIYNNNILFVGGLPEMISRLKAVFSTATFVDNETMAVPQKTDLIVLVGGDTNHALYYKYIGFARDKGIEVIYCNGSNAESITMQVTGCL